MLSAVTGVLASLANPELTSLLDAWELASLLGDHAAANELLAKITERVGW